MPVDARPFQQVQRQMTDWLRDPAGATPPAVEARRLAIYRELFFNNVRGFVEGAYPVLRSLLPEAEWEALVADFFAGHRAQSPYFRDISLEFRTWMEVARADWLAARPWALELLHYEWVELAADCAETPADPPVRPEGDLLEGAPCARQALWVLAYRWPVHTLSPASPPAAAPPAAMTCLLVYRDSEDRVRVQEVSPLAARLVEHLQAQPGARGREVLRSLAAEAGQGGEGESAFLAAGAGLLASLRAADVILGVHVDDGAV